MNDPQDRMASPRIVVNQAAVVRSHDAGVWTNPMDFNGKELRPCTLHFLVPFLEVVPLLFRCRYLVFSPTLTS